MNKFFDQSPLDVAIKLKGKTLKVGSKSGRITKIKTQYPADNKNWSDRPIFGSHPVDAYVASYRGSFLLFLRAGIPGVNSCVRIDGIEVEGELYSSPGQVCKALDIDSERIGKVSVSHDTVSIK